MTVAVITPTVPGRERLLAECVASITAQTVRPAAHVVGLDHDRQGGARMRNLLCRAATDTVSWFAFLDDDDLADPDHLATLLAHTAPDVDVVYSHGRIEGRDGWNPQKPKFDAARLRAGPNYIPMTSLVRTSTFWKAGGFAQSPVGKRRENDYLLWLAILDVGGRFRCVPQTTWTYRFGSWPSVGKRNLGPTR